MERHPKKCSKSIPLSVSTQGVTCTIDYQSEPPEYLIKTTLGQRMNIDEQVDPYSRLKKAVTSFVYKGLLGVHVHPEGVILHLDQEKNFKGEPQHNQPGAQIISGNQPENLKEEHKKRIAEISLKECSEFQPVILNANKNKMYLIIKPVKGQEGEFGVYFSSAKGKERDNAEPAFTLQLEDSIYLNQDFLIQLAKKEGGSMDARDWNASISDPILARLDVTEDGTLIVEEMFTTHGLTIIYGQNNPIFLGFPSLKNEFERQTHREEYIQQSIEINKELFKNLQDRGLESGEEWSRKATITAVAAKYRNDNPDGVCQLALELAIKEILATLYASAGGSETAMLIEAAICKLITSITTETIAWLKKESLRAKALEAVEQIIADVTKAFGIQELKEIMNSALPKNVKNLDPTTAGSSDLSGIAKKMVVSSNHAKELKKIVRELQAKTPDQDNKSLLKRLRASAILLTRQTFERLLVRSVVITALPVIEKAKREKLEQPLAELIPSELETILKRYEAYSEYIDLAFENRITHSLNSAIKSFQQGTNQQNEQHIGTKGFLTFLIAIRSSGGKIMANNDTVPAASSLLVLPNAIPDIVVLCPDPSVPDAFVRIQSQDGTLLAEVPFPIALLERKEPKGVPADLWLTFHTLSSKIIDFYLTGASNRREDQDLHDKIVNTLTERLLLSLQNFLFELHHKPPVDHFDEFKNMLAITQAVWAVRPDEESSEEFLDLIPRPKSMTQKPFCFKQELKNLLIELQKTGQLHRDTYRFKPQIRSFAQTKDTKNQKVVIPLEIRMDSGEIRVRAIFYEESFNSKIQVVIREPSAAPRQKVPADNPSQSSAQQPGQVNKVNQDRILKMMESLPFFTNFSEYEKIRIAEFSANFKIFQGGGELIREGTRDTAFYILIRGCVHVVKGKNTLKTINQGDFFGEIAFLTNSPRTSSIVAADKVLALRIDQHLLEQIGPEMREKIKDQIIRKLVERLSDATNQMRNQMEVGKIETQVKEHSRVMHSVGRKTDIDREQTLILMDRLAFFSKFSPYEKKRIAAFSSQFLTFTPGEELILEDTLDTSFFILIRGQVSVVKGQTQLVKLGPGEVFGEMAFLTNSPRTTTIVADDSVLALKVDQELMTRMGAEIREKIKDRFIYKMTERIANTTDQMAQGMVTDD
ncbi:MAG: cyclic nucleotide-binding domain-containing protein [Magnetococcus sp. DMHC-6]